LHQAGVLIYHSDNRVHGVRGDPEQAFFSEIMSMEQENLTGCV